MITDAEVRQFDRWSFSWEGGGSCTNPDDTPSFLSSENVKTKVMAKAFGESSPSA